MQAITVTDSNDLQLHNVPAPVPSEGEVLIDVAAAGINRADVLQAGGNYPPPAGASDILGLEASGTISALGPGVTSFHVGDEVCALLAGGGYAEQVVAPASQVLPVPPGTDLIEAAALPEAACTVWSNIVMTAGLTEGETILVHGASGGMGSLAIQIARALGARVLATAGSPQRLSRCRELGAEVAIDHHDDVTAAVSEATSGHGVDVIFDVLGAGWLEANLTMLGESGRLAIIGLMTGRRAEIDLSYLMGKRLSIHGTMLRSRPLAAKVAIVEEVAQHVWPMLLAGSVKPIVHDRLPLAEAARGHERLTSGEVFGKLLLLT